MKHLSVFKSSRKRFAKKGGIAYNFFFQNDMVSYCYFWSEIVKNGQFWQEANQVIHLRTRR